MVYILLGEGFEESEAVVPTDLLRRAGIQVSLVGLDGPQITSARGVTITADIALEDVEGEDMEMLVLPGGLGGVESIQMNLFALALIQKAWDQGAYLAAICAAPTILAHIGITDRRKAVCFPGMEDQMGSAVVQKGSKTVVDGHLVTGQGPGASFDFGLKLVEMLRGAEAARTVRDAIHYDR